MNNHKNILDEWEHKFNNPVVGAPFIVNSTIRQESKSFLLQKLQEERERVIEEAVIRHVCIEGCLICAWAEDGWKEKYVKTEEEHETV